MGRVFQVDSRMYLYAKKTGLIFVSFFLFFITTLLVCGGDLTNLPSEYLSRVYIIYFVIIIAFYANVHPDHFYEFLKYTSGINGIFLLLSFLLTGEERFPLWLPLCSFFLQIGIYKGFSYCRAYWKNKNVGASFFENRFYRPQVPANFNHRDWSCLMVNGASTAHTDVLMSEIGSHVKTLILIDSQEENLHLMKTWLMEKFPTLTIVEYFLDYQNYKPQELESFFKTYKIKALFDFDRSYSFSSVEISEENWFKNILFPQRLIDLSKKYKLECVVSLSVLPFIVQGENIPAKYQTAQEWLEAYAQRQDGEVTRVIPLRVLPPRESFKTIYELLSMVKSHKKFEAEIGGAKENILDLLMLLNSDNFREAYGLIWVCVKGVKLSKLVSLSNKKDVVDFIKHIYDSVLRQNIISFDRKFVVHTEIKGIGYVNKKIMKHKDFEGFLEDVLEITGQTKEHVLKKNTKKTAKA